MFNFKLIFIVISTFFLLFVQCKLSDKRLCANEDCTQKISLAKTLMNYGSPEKGILSFKSNADVVIFSKSAGSNMDLWGVEIGGVRGYAPKRFLRETRIFTNKLQLRDTEITGENTSERSAEKVAANKASEMMIVDGTTIYNDGIDATPRENTVRPTVIAGDETNKNVDNSNASESNLQETEPLVLKTTESKIDNVKEEDDNNDGSLAGVLMRTITEFISDNNKEEDEDADEEKEDDTEEDVEIEDDYEESDNKDSSTGDIRIEDVNSNSVDSVKLRQLLSEKDDTEGTTTEDSKTVLDIVKDQAQEINPVEDIKKDNSIVTEIDSIITEVPSNIVVDKQINQTNIADVKEEDSVVAKEPPMDKIVEEVVTEQNMAQQEIPIAPLRSDLNVQDAVVHSEIEDVSGTESNSQSLQEEAVISDDNSGESLNEPNNVKNTSITLTEQNVELAPEPSNLDEALNSPVASEKTDAINTIVNSDIALPLDILGKDNEKQSIELSDDRQREETSMLDKEDAIQEDSVQKVDFESNPEWIDHENDTSPNLESEENSGILGGIKNFLASIESSSTETIETYKTESSKTEEPLADLPSTTVQNEQADLIESGEIVTSQNEDVTAGTTEFSIDISNENVDDYVTDSFTEAPKVEEVALDEPEKSILENTREAPIVAQDRSLSQNSVDYGSCPAGESDCPTDMSAVQSQLAMEDIETASMYDFANLLTLLGVTGFSVVVFLLGFAKIDKSRKEGHLVAKINTLEKALLVASKENALLSDKVEEVQDETANGITSEEYDKLNKLYEEELAIKTALEEQIQGLEKELENSTEVGLELNRMLSDIISSQNGSETLIANVEQLQRQLVEQQSTINSINDTLNLKDTENHELQLELEIKNKKLTSLQSELDKMALNVFRAEEDKEQSQARLEGEIAEVKAQNERNRNAFQTTERQLIREMEEFKKKMAEAQRSLEVKTREYDILKENFNKIKTIKNNTEALESLLNASAMKAELQQLQRDNQNLNEILRQESETKFTLEKQIEIALGEAKSYQAKYDEADRERLEAKTKLEVLSNYFKEKEAQLQKDLSKQESMWIAKQGEASSTVERIRYMQEELQNYKSQNESLKQEIVSQEVDLKSQISVLEKKAHESWVSARQAERRLEDARQEAAQLRNMLTLKERGFIDDKNRIQSPLEQNGDVSAVSPLHMAVDTPASPPLLYGGREHLTTSPPLPNLPPFLPPPPGVPFMPPPIPGVPGFMPPPPSMFPVDHHRPPPLGRMSPPLPSRYSPDNRYSPYDRNSPSPTYDDDDYRSSPPPHGMRGYSPYNSREDRRDYKRGPGLLRSNGRNNKGGVSSGSGNSNESLEKISRHHSKV